MKPFQGFVQINLHAFVYRKRTDLQAAARYDFFNRNGMDTNGFLNMPAVGMNYFFKNCNLKLQAMYQYIARKGHDTQLDRDNDDLGLAVHSASILLQYTF